MWTLAAVKFISTERQNVLLDFNVLQCLHIKMYSYINSTFKRLPLFRTVLLLRSKILFI